MRGHRVITSLALFSLLCQLREAACDDDDSLKIHLKYNGSDNDTLRYYHDKSWFSHHYANLPHWPDEISGHLGQPNPRNACAYVKPLNVTADNWFALVSDYPSCGSSMVTNVRNAGYKLIITSSNNDSHRTVSTSLRNTNFPIVVVTQEFASYLEGAALSNSSSDPITVHITSDQSLPILVITLCCFFVVITCCTASFCVCVCYCVFRRDNNVERRLEQLEHRRRDFDNQQRQERLARQELIQSILRQLQELQLDVRHQIPLGQEETERLPKRQYQPGKDTCETCAICVDDFTEEDVVRLLPCSHVFHPQCIDEWLINHSSLCPLCKMELPRQQDRAHQQDDDNDQQDSDAFSTVSSASDSPLLPRGNRSSGQSSLRPVYGSV